MVTRIVVITVAVLGGIGLQIWLSKKQNKWLGLILPILILVGSIVVVLQIVFVEELSQPRRYISLLYTLAEVNIPTLALFIIYKIYHKSPRKK